MMERAQSIQEQDVRLNLIIAESFSTKREAMQAEYYFKKLTRKKKELYIEEKRIREAVYVQGAKRALNGKSDMGILYISSQPHRKSRGYDISGDRHVEKSGHILLRKIRGKRKSFVMYMKLKHRLSAIMNTIKKAVGTKLLNG
jgi:hypothetical protein